MFNKKAQGEIITTVLIILLVLAAIVIVWQVVQGTVNKAGSQAQAASGCIGMNLQISTASGDDSDNQVKVKVKRGNDNLKLEAIKFIVEQPTGNQLCTPEESVATNLPLTFGEKEITIPCAIGTEALKVKIAPKINGQQCDVVTYYDFTSVA